MICDLKTFWNWWVITNNGVNCVNTSENRKWWKRSLTKLSLTKLNASTDSTPSHSHHYQLRLCCEFGCDYVVNLVTATFQNLVVVSLWIWLWLCCKIWLRMRLCLNLVVTSLWICLQVRLRFKIWLWLRFEFVCDNVIKFGCDCVTNLVVISLRIWLRLRCKIWLRLNLCFEFGCDCVVKLVEATSTRFDCDLVVNLVMIML